MDIPVIETDTLLKIWAVVGPLLAASASAVWARRIQLQDREHEDKRAQTARSYAIEDGKTSHTRAISDATRAELRSAASDFITSIHEYVVCASAATRDSPSDGAHEEFVNARKAMNRTFSRVVLLGSQDLAVAASLLQGATTALPTGNVDGKLDEATLAAFKDVREKFITLSRDSLKIIA